MNFRYARHTNDLEPIINFYTKVIGLVRLGGFEDHANYNGVFLGLPNSDWHLEFTESDDEAKHKPDDDDLVVFYEDSQEELKSKLKVAEALGIVPVKSKNPYWQLNGIEFKDPDGFGVMLAVRP